MVPTAKAECGFLRHRLLNGPDEDPRKRNIANATRALNPLARKGLVGSCHIVRPLLQDHPALGK